MSEEASPFAVSHVSYTYEEVPVLRDISLSVEGGSLVGILGPNGAGKSSFLKCAVDILRPQVGSFSFWGKSFREQSNRIAYIPQRASVDWTFPITVSEVVQMGALPRLGLWGSFQEKDQRDLEQCLKAVGLLDLAHRQIGCLSGGQQQKTFLARALMQQPDLLLLDEPFAGIDAAAAADIMAILRGLVASGKTILLVHHDLMVVSKFFDSLLLLNRHLIAYGKVEDVFTTEKLSQAYGQSSYLFSEVFQRSADSDILSL
ncbi:metal ABC transporter ATP-binding protein [Candidatus Similichlamydia laticola]|uniref:Manganese ABC transporter, ATP-binding protein SitB n=1 Tax=Candidatus Similichlamydia laticola TaxID=2170265 RepID=A0A369KJC5_9BACT|nr:metal ABC transporter ATP-binding protein [Candidatus Similichlamydia laticola]RDB31854.1 Manganese ABC transporter, ATP-binding protein SitB [Candidatus Similichlamydia laticola]